MVCLCILFFCFGGAKISSITQTASKIAQELAGRIQKQVVPSN